MPLGLGRALRPHRATSTSPQPARPRRPGARCRGKVGLELPRASPGAVALKRPLPGCLAGRGCSLLQARETTMLHLLGFFSFGYLAAAGVATNAAVMGRGLVRAARSAAGGDLRGAAVEALGALAAPVALSYAATANLLLDVVGGAADLVRPVLHEGDPEGGRCAA